MPSKALPPDFPERYKADIEAVEQALRDGCPPPGTAGNKNVRGAIRIAAERLGQPHNTLGGRLRSCRSKYGIEPDWSLYVPEVCGEVSPEGQVEPVTPIPAKIGGSGRKTRRFILTCAQNNTKLHEGAWANLRALAAHYGARLMVSRFTYDRRRYGQGSVKPGQEPGTSDFSGLWYDPRLTDHLADDRIEIAPGLIFVGDANLEPTAVSPLSSLEGMTGRASSIFPHVKHAMTSVPSGKYEPTKLMWTTGTVTLRNYIAKKAGLKADFHHSYGALLIEVDRDGDWFARQLGATDSDGTIHDLDVKVQNGKVTTGNRVEAITWGDIHTDQIDPEQRALAWGAGGIIDRLRPRYQFFHDLIDFRSRNHHDRGNPYLAFEKWVEERDSVEAEFGRGAEFLHFAHRDWCQAVAVDSNHDRAFERWLREHDWRTDPPNMSFFLEAALERVRAIQRGDSKRFHLVEWALRRLDCPPEVRFLQEDESFVICPDANGGIECGMHGDRGPNGARGSAPAFARMSRKMNIGDKHSAGIHHGVYIAGLIGNLDQGYNTGPSSWSHSNIITYPTGKRTIQTSWNGKAWAA